MRAAVEAHGGLAAIQGANQLSFRWEGFDYAPTQGRVPRVDWDTSGNGRPVTQDMRFDLARNRYILEREFGFAGGYVNAFRAVGNGREVMLYNHLPERGMGGTEYSRDTVGTLVVRQRNAGSITMPVLQLRMALARLNTLRYLGAVEDGGRREDVVAFSTAEGDPVTLYFDAATHLMTRREDMGIGSLGDEVDTYHFSDYRTLHGLAVPHRIEIRWNGILTGRHQLVRFATTADLPDSLFEAPRGYTLPVPGGPATVEMIAEGIAYVERIGGGYRMLVVDTDEGLVVVDAPISVQATTGALALVAKAFPDRPIRHLVLTHHHGDHISGLGAFAGRGTTVLVAPGSEAYLRRMSTVRRTIGSLVPPDTVAAPQMETVHGRRRIGKGARSIEIIDAGPTSHASSMLVVYVPSQKLLFQGDLLRINRAGGPVVSPDATRDLDRIIRRERLDVRSIGAVHGLNGTMEDLRTALARSR